jgi:hypothetical protein
MFVKRGILLIGFAVLTIHISTGFADDCAKVVACQSSGTKVDGFNLYEGSPMCSKLLEAIPYEKISECEVEANVTVHEDGMVTRNDSQFLVDKNGTPTDFTDDVRLCQAAIATAATMEGATNKAVWNSLAEHRGEFKEWYCARVRKCHDMVMEANPNYRSKWDTKINGYTTPVEYVTHIDGKSNVVCNR